MRALSFENASDEFDADEPQDVVQFIRDGSFTDELLEEDAVAHCTRCDQLFFDTDDANAHVEAFNHRVRWTS